MVIRTMRSATTLKISSGNTANLTIVSFLSYKHGMYLLVMSITFKSFGNSQSCSLYYPVISLSIALSISLTFDVIFKNTALLILLSFLPRTRWQHVSKARPQCTVLPPTPKLLGPQLPHACKTTKRHHSSQALQASKQLAAPGVCSCLTED